MVRLFWSPCCSPGWYRYLYKPSSGSTVSSRYVWSSYIPIIDYTIFFILFTILFNFQTQMFDTFSGFWSSWASIGLNNSFGNYLLKASTKAVRVCLCFIVTLRISALCFSSILVTSFLNLDPLSHWNTLRYLNTPPFLQIAFNANATLLDFLVLRSLATLYLDATSTPVQIYLYVFPSKTLWGM